MAGEQDVQGGAPAEVEAPVAEVTPTKRRTPTQAEYYSTRRAAKERAADTIEQNAKDAKKAKDKALAKSSRPKGQAEFEKRAKEIEASINKPQDEGTE